jgi:hypothetical protein
VASTNDPDQALSYLHRACSLANLAVKHIDLAVAVISSFLDPKDVAETAEMADEDAYTSEVCSCTMYWFFCCRHCDPIA